jgi:signal transduction histidine kinase
VGYVELIQEAIAEGKPSLKRMEEDFNAIQASSQHIVSLLDELLDLAKIEADELELRP